LKEVKKNIYEIMYGHNSLQNYNNVTSYANALALGGAPGPTGATQLLYGLSNNSTETLLRNQAALQIQQRHHAAAAANAEANRLNKLGKSLPKKRKEDSENNEVIEIDDSSDDESSINKKRARPIPPSTSTGDSAGNTTGFTSQAVPAAKRAKQQQPQQWQQGNINLPGLSRKAVVGTLRKSEGEKVQKVLHTVLFHATGYNASTAPKTMPWPPLQVTMKITKIHDFVKEIVKRQMEELKIVVETTIQHCTRLIENQKKEQASLKETPAAFAPPAPAPPRLPTSNELLLKQSKAISGLQKEIIKLRAENKDLKDSLGKQQIRTSTMHARSVNAYMRASVQSLRYLREIESDQYDTEEEGTNDVVMRQE
jgi:cell division protein FtsB